MHFTGQAHASELVVTQKWSRSVYLIDFSESPLLARLYLSIGDYSFSQGYRINERAKRDQTSGRVISWKQKAEQQCPA